LLLFIDCCLLPPLPLPPPQIAIADAAVFAALC
jgi:hypothetical protein